MRVALVAVFVSLFCASCAAGLCERRARFFERQCAGTEVVFDKDPTCRDRIEGCSDLQRQQMDAYVSCLEASNQCSMAVVAQCAQAHPGGVNLSCPRPN